MRIMTAALIAAMLLVSGCATVGIDTIRPGELHEPVFVVVPASAAPHQQSYAAAVEAILIESGARVVRKPDFQSIRLEVPGSTGQPTLLDRTILGGPGFAVQADETRIVDAFLELGPHAGNYRLNTYAETRQVEIIDLETNQILSLCPLMIHEPPNSENMLLKTLESMGLQVSPRPAKPGEWYKVPRPLAAGPAQLEPVFTVLPVTDSQAEVDFAITIQRLLVRLGLSVIRPPAPVYRVEFTPAASGADADVPGKAVDQAGPARLFLSSFQIDETPADIIIETSAYRRHVKIVDRESGEIQAVFPSPAGSDKNKLKRLREALVEVGIPVAMEI